MPFVRPLAVIALLLAAAAPADAALITRLVNVKLTATPDGPNQQYDLDVDLDGTTDFTFRTIIGIPDDPTFASFTDIVFPFGTQNAAVVDAAVGNGFPTVSRLAVGDVVSAGDTFSGPNDLGNLFFVTLFDPPSGNFAGRTGFAGLRFESGGQLYYGYAQLTLNGLFAPSDPLALTIGAVGYESVAGAPAVIAPEPASVLLAGVGLAVLGVRRRTGR
ncbi:MAG: PEP-CTERM sorting domain-containing protein [Gemmataceae bacterium]|nr:PEP-CTERM sorting domain-containing protein [Gemmataceae bacterium]